MCMAVKKGGIEKPQTSHEDVQTIARVPLTPENNAGFATGDDGKQRVACTELSAPTRRSTAKRRVRCGWVGVLGVFTSKRARKTHLSVHLCGLKEVDRD